MKENTMCVFNTTRLKGMKTSMHSSRMRTARLSGRLSCTHTPALHIPPCHAHQPRHAQSPPAIHAPPPPNTLASSNMPHYACLPPTATHAPAKSYVSTQTKPNAKATLFPDGFLETQFLAVHVE